MVYAAKLLLKWEHLQFARRVAYRYTNRNFNKIIGYIFNQGNPENTHKFCELYHNGEITVQLMIMAKY